MPAVKQDIKIEEGVNFQMVVDVSGHAGSLSGATARMEIREYREAVDVLLAHTPSVDTVNKQVVVDVPHADTTGLLWRTGEYDIELTVGSAKYRIVEGRVTVSPEVTRS
jgi:hypothetical protein